VRGINDPELGCHTGTRAICPCTAPQETGFPTTSDETAETPWPIRVSKAEWLAHTKPARIARLIAPIYRAAKTSKHRKFHRPQPRKMDAQMP